MSDFPRMIYRVGDQEEMHGGRYDYEIVHDQDALDALLGDGWYMTTQEARKAHEAPEESKPSRADIEAEALSLGIQFDGRTSDARLMAKIDTAKNKEQP